MTACTGDATVLLPLVEEEGTLVGAVAGDGGNGGVCPIVVFLFFVPALVAALTTLLGGESETRRPTSQNKL